MWKVKIAGLPWRDASSAMVAMACLPSSPLRGAAFGFIGANWPESRLSGARVCHVFSFSSSSPSSFFSLPCLLGAALLHPVGRMIVCLHRENGTENVFRSRNGIARFLVYICQSLREEDDDGRLER